MRAVLQRVRGARLSVDGKKVSEIGDGLVVYLGVGKGDGESECEAVARKICSLRIFSDEAGKMNLSLLSTGKEALIVSQFTLYGDASHGNRPSFTEAEQPDRAKMLYERVCELTESGGVKTARGVFGADMLIEQECDGPVTIVYEVRSKQ